MSEQEGDVNRNGSVHGNGKRNTCFSVNGYRGLNVSGNGNILLLSSSSSRMSEYYIIQNLKT